MIVLDTPGVMRTAFNALDETMLKSVKSSVATADCLILVVDGDAKDTAEKDFEHLLDDFRRRRRREDFWEDTDGDLRE